MLGTSSPPVRVMAMRMARASALKAASALGHQYSPSNNDSSMNSHVMIVLAPDVVNVQRHASGKCE